MRVCVDIQSAITQRAGVGRYTRSLVQHLAETAGDNELRLTYFDFKRRALPFPAPNAQPRAIRWCPGRLAQFAWKTFNWPPFDFFAGPADLYHFPNFIIPPLRKGKSAVNIHDLSFLRFPEFAEEKNRQYLSARIRDTVERADAIITGSQFSADEITGLLQVDPARIFAIPYGISEDFGRLEPDSIAPVLGRLGVSRPYLLTVGTLEPRKNIPFLIEVFEKLADFHGTLVIAGMPGWKYEPILERMRISRRNSGIRHLKYVDDADLPALYAGAELFLLASFYEGFGFPPLEAMACGTPVISSGRGSLAEVLGPAAEILDEFDSDLWADRVAKLLSDPRLRAERADRGRAQASRYTWAETAGKTWDVYRKVTA